MSHVLACWRRTCHGIWHDSLDALKLSCCLDALKPSCRRAVYLKEEVEKEEEEEEIFYFLMFSMLTIRNHHNAKTSTRLSRCKSSLSRSFDVA